MPETLLLTLAGVGILAAVTTVVLVAFRPTIDAADRALRGL